MMTTSLMRTTCGCIWIHGRNASTDTRSRIRVPHQMIQKLEKIQLKTATKLRQQQRFYKGPLIISCKRSEYNHYHGQTYSNFNPEHLASHGWKHDRSKGDYFTINSYTSNPALDVDEEDSCFSRLGLNNHLIQALRDINITEPTKIQAKAIPVLLERANVLCASETGSGKTLAYLLPLLEWMYRRNRVHGPTVDPNSPQGVVLVPSRELAEQIKTVADSIAPSVGCRTSLMVGGKGTQKILRYRPKAPVDLLISTPGIMSKLLTNKLYDLSRLSNIVLDEADTLMDDSFSTMTLRIIRKLNVASERLEYGSDVETIGTQLALVSATLPRSLNDLLKDIVPMETIETVTTPHLHRIMSHVPQKFVRLGPAQRPDALTKALQSNVKRNIPTLVFCNKAATSYYLGHILDDLNIPNIILNGDMPQKVREGRFDEFQSGACDVLICTDVASRGLDTIRAQHVINYEFPNFMSDYIHRVGRVGRVRSQGTSFVLSFITYKWDVDLLWKIEAAARRVTDLHNVNANIKRKLTSLAENKELHEEAS